MRKLLTTLNYDHIDFAEYSSQQFATVVFDRGEDDDKTLITVISGEKINQKVGHNKYNPSLRRRSTCVYVQEETCDKMIKICTIQHKGSTLVQIYDVDEEELLYLFGKTTFNLYGC